MFQFDVNFPEGNFGSKQSDATFKKVDAKSKKQKLNDEIVKALGLSTGDTKPATMPNDIYFLPEAEKDKLRNQGFPVPEQRQINDPMTGDIYFLPKAEKDKLRNQGFPVPEPRHINDPMPMGNIGSFEINKADIE